MKLLIILLAMAATGVGAVHSWHTRQQFVQAALLSEAFDLTAPVKLRVADHYVKQGTMPQDNADAGLPPPQSVYGTSVKRVSINRGGVLLVDFAERIGDRSMTFTPTVSPVSGLLNWRCTSGSIEPAVLAKLKPACNYLPDTRESRLMHAIANADVAKVKTLLQEGARPEAVVNGNTPLMLAAKTGNVAIVKQLLDAGAHVDNAALNYERRTPLMVAITSDNSEVANLLLSAGASVTRKDFRELNALDHATATDRRLGGERYTLMVSARFNPRFAGGAEVDSLPVADVGDVSDRLQHRFRELRQAALDCHVQRLGSLLRANQDLASDELVAGKPLASHIRKPGCVGVLEDFLQTKRTYRESAHARMTGLIRSCDVKQVEALMRQNAFIDVAENLQGQSHLDQAIVAGCPRLVSTMVRDQDLAGKFDDDVLLMALYQSPQESLVPLIGTLIAGGADVNGRDEDGQTPLAAAIALEQPVVAKYLIDAGADVNATTVNRSTPLIEATKKGYTHLVAQLLGGGAAIDRRDALGRTALIAAVGTGSQRLVDSLIRAGANLRIKDADGIDALLLADSQDLRSIKSLLTASIE